MINVRSHDGEITLADYLAKHIITQSPELVDEIMEVSKLLTKTEKMAGIDIAVNEIDTLHRRVTSLQETAEKLGLAPRLEQFFQQAVTDVTLLLEKGTNVANQGNQLCETYVEKKITDLLRHIGQFYKKISQRITIAQSVVHRPAEIVVKAPAKEERKRRTDRPPRKAMLKRQGSWEVDGETGILQHMKDKAKQEKIAPKVARKPLPNPKKVRRHARRSIRTRAPVKAPASDEFIVE